MSTSQKTSDNKTHRHIQAISMLLGHRGKTPSMIKQRTKSPISVIHTKTPRLSNMLKYQQFFSSLLKTFQMNKLKHKQDVFSHLKLKPQQHHYPKYQVQTPLQLKLPQNQKYNRKIKSVQTIEEFIEIFTNKLLLQAFQTLKHYIPDQTRIAVRINKTHRKTYSQMYTDLVHYGRSRTPSKISNYEYCTPEVKKELSYEIKSNQTRILFLLSSKIIFKKISSTFSQLKSHSGKLIINEIQSLKQNQELNKQEVEQINRQVATLERKNKLMEKQLQQSELKLKQFTLKVNQLQNEINLATKTQQNVKRQCETLRRLVETTKIQLETRNKQLEAVKKQILSQKTINEKNSKESMSLKRQLEATQRQCQSTKKQLAKRLQELSKKSQELLSINEQFKLAKEKFQNKLRAIQKEPNPLESLMKELQSQKRELQNEMMKQKNLKKQLERKLIKVENQLQTAQNSILQMEQTEKSNTEIIKYQQKQLSTVKKEFETMRKELETTNIQMGNSRKQLETLRKQRLLTQNQLKSMRKDQLKRSQELESIQRQLQNKENQLYMKEKSLLLRQQQLIEIQKELSNREKLLESQKNEFNLKPKQQSKDPKRKQNQSAVIIDIDSRDSELQSLKRQLLLSKQQHYQATNSLLLSQKLLNEEKQKTFLLSQKQQQKQKQLLLHNQQKKAQLLNLQKKVSALIIYQILTIKLNSKRFKFIQALSEIPIIKSSIHSNCLYMEKVINTLMKDRKKVFFKHLSQTLLKHYSQKDIQFVQRSLTSQFKIKSIYSSKHSLSNASLITNNFDQFAKKINKAFQLKNTLHQIYQYCFQKIDYAALLYLGISNPINKLIHKHMLDSFRKVLFFSFSQNQQSINNIQSEDSQIIKKGEKILSFFKKLDNKIVFTKIQAYSLLKMNADLKKKNKIPDEPIISQSQLKRELNDFLQQRNKVYQKTFQTWQRTKQMISDYRLASSQRSY